MTWLLNDVVGDTIDWVLAVVAAGLWSSIYAIYLWREEWFRRWLSLSWAQIADRRATRARAAAPPSRPVPAFGADFRLRPRTAPPRRPAYPTIEGSTARAVESEPEPVRIAQWRVDHLPLRYRLLGQVRQAANDN